MKNPGWYLSKVFIGIAVLAVLVGGIVFILITRIPPASQQLTPNSAPITVIFAAPETDSQWPADAFVPVRAIVMSSGEIAAVELWADGKLVNTFTPAAEADPGYTLVTWTWLPLTEGHHVLLVRARGVSGKVSTSSLINVTASPAAGFRVLEDLDGGEDGAPIFENQPSFLTEFSPSSTAAPPVPAPLTEDVAPSANGFSLWLERTFSGISALPAAPGVAAASDGCDVILSIQDLSDSEKGFFIYRALQGLSSFERIETLGPLDQEQLFQFRDPDQTGTLVYYVAAFNSAGESPGEILMVSLDAPGCPAADETTLEYIDGKITLPEPVEKAYYYYAFNGGAYSRFPMQPYAFLTPQESQLPLDDFIDIWTAAYEQTAKTLDLEVWGWEGGALIKLGKAHINLDYTELKICNLGTDCSGDMGSTFRSTYGEINLESEDLERAFYWSSNISGADQLLWQISSSPFDDSFDPQPPGLLANDVQKGGKSSGSFVVDLGNLEQYNPAEAGGFELLPYMRTTSPYTSSLLPYTQPDTWYMRMIPMSGSQAVGRPSKSVVINLVDTEPEIEPVILDHLPDLYSLEILNFEPIDFADPALWGCVYIESLNLEKIKDSLGSSVFPGQEILINQQAEMLYNILHEYKTAHKPVCPAAFKGNDDSMLGQALDDLYEGLKTAWDTLIEFYNSIKQGIVNTVAELINNLGIECNDTCKEGLMKGLEIGIAYFTGIPPTLPTFEEATNMGIDYAIELAAAEAGIPCEEACQAVLREGLKQVAEANKQSQSQPGCVSRNWSQAFDQEPLCFPAGVETSPVPEGLLIPATTQLRVTNNSGVLPGDYQYYEQPAYVVTLNVEAINSQLVGQTFRYYYEYSVEKPIIPPSESNSNSTPEEWVNEWVAGMNSTESGQIYLSIPITSPLSGEVFRPVTIPIPPLAPGESVTIPVALVQNSLEYIIPAHLEALNAELAARDLSFEDLNVPIPIYDVGDWSCLYKGSEITLEAEISCLSMPQGLIGQTQPGPDSEYTPCDNEPVFRIYQEASDMCIQW
ncbi:MAG: hypothetical protein JXA25_09110 [Anaerolineales bacterium]|nr:hypothetical protein [Anaerolineales bacterium]